MSFARVTLALLLGSTAHASGDLNCNDYGSAWESLKPKKTANECKAMIAAQLKKCDEGTADSTAGIVNSTGAETSCLEKVLNTELDKRLLKLKSKDEAQFSKEMALQADFKKSVTSVCDKLNNCEGSMYRMTGAQCRHNLVEWRLTQAERINRKAVVLDSTAAPAASAAPPNLPKDLNDANVGSFAKNFCALPLDVFKSGKLPETCEARVKASFAEAAGMNCHDGETSP